jgi:hypothetical protein
MKPLEPVKDCLEKMKDALGVAKVLINRAKGLRGCQHCVLLCNIELSKITEWQTSFDHIFQQLHTLLIASKMERPSLPSSTTIDVFIREIRDVLGLEENFQVLKMGPEFSNTEEFLSYVCNGHK